MQLGRIWAYLSIRRQMGCKGSFDLPGFWRPSGPLGYKQSAPQGVVDQLKRIVWEGKNTSSQHKAPSKCGFDKTINVRGLMDGFQKDSRFPFYCQHCGLVEANIAEFIGNTKAEKSSIKQGEIQKTPICLHCGSTHVDQYGKPPASLKSTKQTRSLQA